MRVRTGQEIEGCVVHDRVVLDAASIANCSVVKFEGCDVKFGEVSEMMFELSWTRTGLSSEAPLRIPNPPSAALLNVSQSHPSREQREGRATSRIWSAC